MKELLFLYVLSTLIYIFGIDGHLILIGTHKSVQSRSNPSPLPIITSLNIFLIAVLRNEFERRPQEFDEEAVEMDE